MTFAGMALPTAAVVGYSVGLVFAYVLISRKVFSNGWLKERRKTEFALFLVSGLLGIGLTYGVSSLVVALFGNMLNTAKLASVGVSFSGVYVFRKLFVFRDKPSITQTESARTAAGEIINDCKSPKQFF